jgi:tetratricopeptide (TPR) repeat protein
MTTSPKNALTVLTRLAARRSENTSLLETALRDRLDALAISAVEVAAETGDPIGKVLAELLDTRTYEQFPKGLEEGVPTETIAMRELRLVIVRKRFEAVVYQRPLNDLATVWRAIHILRDYAEALTGVGNLTAARNTYLETLQLMNKIALQGYPAGIAYKATLWHNLARVEADLGSFNDAKNAGQEAVELHTEALKLGFPSQGLLAQSESNLATILIGQQDYAEAKRLLQDGVRRLADIGDSSAVDDRFHFARVHHNLAIALRRLGELREARTSAEIATVTIRQLAEAMPDAYRGYLARYLINRGEVAMEIGETEEAANDLDEAVILLNELNLQRPDVFANDYLLAISARASLHDNSNLASDIESVLGRTNLEPRRWRVWWAFAARRQTADLGDNWKERAAILGPALAKIQDDASSSDERTSEEIRLSMLHSIALTETGNNATALEVITDALHHAKLLPKGQGLVAEIRVLRGGLLGDLGQSESAMTEFVESITSRVEAEDCTKAVAALLVATEVLGHKLEPTSRLSFIDQLKSSLKKLSGSIPPSVALVISIEQLHALVCAANAGQGFDEAVAEAARVTTQLVHSSASDPMFAKDLRKDLHFRLRRSAMLLSKNEPMGEWIPALLRAAREMLGPESHLDPELREYLFESMMDDARYFITHSNTEKAFEVFEEAVTRQRQRYQASPAEPPLGLAACLDHWSLALHKAGRHDQALQTAQEAAEAYEQAFLLQPESMWLDYAAGLNNLSNRYRDVGQNDKAILPLERGLALFEEHATEDRERAMRIQGTLLGSYVERSAKAGLPTEGLLHRYVRSLKYPRNVVNSSMTTPDDPSKKPTTTLASDVKVEQTSTNSDLARDK